MVDETKPTGAPLIGQFSGPKGNKPRKASDDSEDLQRNADAPNFPISEMDEGEEEEVRSPEEKYLARLKKVGLSIEKARIIRDNMLFNHFHEETYLIGNKLPVVLRTRDYGDAQRAMRRLEAEAPQYAMSINDLVAHCNMAASLSKYGDKSFKLYTPDDDASEEEREESFDARSRYLQRLPTTVVDSLMSFAAEFDEMIAAVFATGAPEDF